MKLLCKSLLFTLFFTITSGQIVPQNEEINRNFQSNFNQPNKLPINDYTFQNERKDKKIVNNNESIVNKNKLSQYIPLKEHEPEQKQQEMVEKPIPENYYGNIKNFQYNQNFESNQPEKPINHNLNKNRIPEQPTIYDTAVKYWTENKCEYPPKDFYEIFKNGCDITFNNLEFTPGLCYAFFNSTTELCSLDVDEESKNTLLSISSIQSNIENDAICDTLSSMKQDFPGLFPDPVGQNAWYKQTSQVMFSDKCKYACGLRGAHPICFGFFINYDVLSSEHGNKNPKKEPETQVNQVSADFEKQKTEVVDDFVDIQDQKNYKFNANSTNRPYRPNPKVLLNQQFSLSNENYFSNYYDPYLEENSLIVADGGILSDAIEYNEDENEKDKDSNEEDGSEDVLEVAKPLLEEEYLLSFDGKTFDKTFDKLVDQDYDIKLDVEDETINEDQEALEDLKHELENEISDINKKLSPFKADMSFSSAEMMANFIFLSLGIVVVLLLLIVFKASRRGLRRLRVGRNGRNWNYERVQNINPNEDIVYEN